MPTKYGTQVKSFDLGEFGSIRYAQWLHPYERPKTFDDSCVRWLRKYIREGDTVIDIGAHTGDTTLPLAVAAGREGLVIAFEPNPAVFEILQENAHLNHQYRIVCENQAIMEKPGKYVFHYSDADLCNGGYAELLSVGIANHISPLEVRAVNLSQYIGEFFQGERISYLKIDTEGYDKEIIRHNRGLLEQHRPILDIEIFPSLTQAERADLWSLLAGYETYLEGTDRKVSEQDVLREKAFFNIVCVPK